MHALYLLNDVDKGFVQICLLYLENDLVIAPSILRLS